MKDVTPREFLAFTWGAFLLKGTMSGRVGDARKRLGAYATTYYPEMSPKEVGDLMEGLMAKCESDVVDDVTVKKFDRIMKKC